MTDFSNPFASATNEGHEEVRDSLGGFSRLDTDIYTGTVALFFSGASASGAKNVTVEFSGGDFTTPYRETIYYTNRAGDTFYHPQGDQTKKVSLPGFVILNDLCLATAGKTLNELSDIQEKTVNVYDSTAKKEVPTKVWMAMEVVGKEVSLAIQKSLVNRQEKDGQGNYVDKADGSTQEENNIEKVFHTASRKTVSEAKQPDGEAAFWDKWLERNKGQTRDKTTKGNTQSGRPGTPPQQGAGNAGNGPAKSLFG